MMTFILFSSNIIPSILLTLLKLIFFNGTDSQFQNQYHYSSFWTDSSDLNFSDDLKLFLH